MQEQIAIGVGASRRDLLDLREPSRIALLAGAIGTAAAVLLYLLLFWNRFAGLRSGVGDYYGGLLILKGQLPYRNYFTAGPPFTALRSALVLLLFGKAYIVSRAFGVFERILLAIVIYGWLARMFKASHATLAAIVTIIVGTGDISDPISSYNHEAILWGVICGLLASYVLDPGRHSKRPFLFALGSGVCGALSCTTKQTIGIGVTAAVVIVAWACLLRLDGLRRSFAFVLAFSVGWILVIASLIVWLTATGSIETFLVDIFMKGPAAKASHSSDFLFRALLVLHWYKVPAAIGAIGAILSAPAWWISGRRNEFAGASVHRVVTVFLASVIATAIAVPATHAGFWHGRTLVRACIYLTFISMAAICISHFALWLLGHLKRRQAQLLLYASVSLATAFMLSLSWPAFEAMVVPGLGLIVATVMQIAGRKLEYLVCAGSAALIFFATVVKLNVPFGFAGYDEPAVSQANVRSTLPQMRGFMLPPSIVRFIDGTVRIIDNHSGPNDTIFTYPEFALFYALSGRSCPTLTCSHNIDVVNDQFARDEAKRLLNGRPAVIIYCPVSEAALVGDENLWRHGKRSGQRDLINAVETLISHYHLAATFHIPSYPGPVQVDFRK